MRLGLAADERVALDIRSRRLIAGETVEGLELIEAGDRRPLIALAGAHGMTRVARRVVVADAPSARAWATWHRDWLDALGRTGLSVLPAAVQEVAPPEGGRVLWLVRPNLPGDARLAAVLGRADEALATTVLDAVLEAIVAATTPEGLGLDARPQGWGWLDGEVVYAGLDRPVLAQGTPGPELREGPLRPWARLAWPLLGLTADLDRGMTRRGAIGTLLEGLRGSPWLDLALARAAGPLDRPWTASEVEVVARRAARRRGWLARARRG